MSGHSHWANIQHKKGIVDAKRGRLWSKLSRAIIRVGAPGTHGATVIGTHGIGVNTPSAAAVAAATSGLAGLMHMPKGGMLTIGM